MSALTGATANETSADASTKLAEAIDDFLGDLEKKFKGISDEILGRLDDMAERCDRLEQEMVLRENSVQAQSSADGGDEGDGGR
jgi:heat shock factor-binding protein 1